jgi:hypothetical protein
MTRRLALVGLLALGGISAACVSQAGGMGPASNSASQGGPLVAVPQASSAAPSTAALGAVTAIAPVSRSNPSLEAAAALKLCGVNRIGIDHVAQMGEIPSARDAARYVPLHGIEPELQTSGSAWLIVFSGKIDLGHAYWAQDPICAVIDGTPTFFEPGPYGRGDTTEVPPTPPIQPTQPLPTLAP